MPTVRVSCSVEARVAADEDESARKEICEMKVRSGCMEVRKMDCRLKKMNTRRWNKEYRD